MTSKSPPQIVVLNQMAGPLTWELVEDLAASGCRVALLTGHPDTLAKGSRTNLSLHRSFRYRRGSMLLRSFCWTLYLVHAFVWLWRWPRQTPLLVFSNPPMLAWLSACMKVLRGTPFVVMIHDIYPELPIRMGKIKDSGLVARIWRRWNRWAYNRADAVLTIGEFMSSVVQEQFDAPSIANKVHIIYPWADTDRIKPIVKSNNPFAIKHGQTDKLTIMYSGNMGLGHDLETMLEATRLVDDQRAHFLFVGAGPKWSMINRTIKQDTFPNVTLLSWLPEEAIASSLAVADIAMVSLEPEVSGLAIPSKAFYSLAAGSPLIVISDSESELAEIVNRYECGWLVAPGDKQGLAAIVNRMLASPSDLDRFKRNARATAEQIGARSTNCKKFVSFLRSHL